MLSAVPELVSLQLLQRYKRRAEMCANYRSGLLGDFTRGCEPEEKGGVCFVVGCVYLHNYGRDVREFAG